MQQEHLNWLKQQLNETVVVTDELPGGKNNKAWRLTAGIKTYFVKLYFDDGHLRFERETQFLTLLSKHDVPGAAKLIAKDKRHRIAVFQWLDGTMDFSPEKQHVNNAAGFICDINTPAIKAQAKHIRPARGAMVCLHDFLTDIEQRLDSFAGITQANKVDIAFTAFLDTVLVPEFAKIKELFAAKPELEQSFTPCLSPSDYGFHNALLGERLSFVDFEYAGWDSAEKLVTDFFAQPRHDVPLDWMPLFVKRAFADSQVTAVLDRCEQLMPLAHLKWALIYLNDFKPDESKRRQFSMADYKQNEIKLAQLSKARRRMTKIQQMMIQDEI